MCMHENMVCVLVSVCVCVCVCASVCCAVCMCACELRKARACEVPDPKKSPTVGAQPVAGTLTGKRFLD